MAYEELFDVIAYGNGFGIGTDLDQRQLLDRIAVWVRPEGHLLMDVFNPGSMDYSPATSPS